MGYILSQILRYGIPLGALAFFIVSLVRFCGGRKANRQTPGAVPVEEMRARKIMLVVSSAIIGLLAAVVIGLAILLFTAFTYMYIREKEWKLFLTLLAFFGIPLGAVVFFVASLVRFCGARKKNKLTSGNVSSEEKRARETMLIASLVIMGVLVAVVISFIALAEMSMGNM